MEEAILEKVNPRSRPSERIARLKGKSMPTEARAILPGPVAETRPTEKNARACSVRKRTSKANKTRLEWKRQASSKPATSTL